MKTDQSDKPAQRKKNSVPIAFWAVALLVILCVSAAMFLVPSDTAVMKRLTTDGKIERLREIVSEKIGREPTDSDLLEHAVSELGKDGWDEAGIETVEQLATNIEEVEEGYKVITKIEKDIPAGPAAAIYSRLAHRALAEENPKLAAQVFQSLGNLSGMSEERTSEIVSSLRAASAPGEALDVLIKFKEDNGGELPDSFSELYDTLALESENVGLAFDSALERFDKNKKNPEMMRKAIDKLITAGSHAGKTDKLIPLCDEYLATTKAGKMTWLEIVKARHEDPNFTDKEFAEVAREAAKFGRWNDMPDKSFDLFRKLAALGDKTALQECIDLHKPLLRESEMATVLDAFVPVEGKPEYTLLAAQIHAKRTDYAAADELYHQHLEANPKDAKVWAELGGMWDATSEFSQALDAYRKGAKANPEDEQLKKRIARTLVTMGDFEGALDSYARMKKYDRKILTSYLTLASNLGHAGAANDALRKWFTLPGERRKIDYIRLARSYAALGQNDSMIKVYERGMKVFPKDREIVIELARELSMLRRHSEVMSLISRKGLRNDAEAMSLHLSSALASKNYRTGLAFSGTNAESRLTLPISAKLPLAEIYYQTGNVSKSNKLYNSIPKSEMPALTQATIAFRRGQFGSAESLLRKHLASNKKDHKSWSFLASIYQAQRKKPQAQDAYQRALDLLKADMKRRS